MSPLPLAEPTIVSLMIGAPLVLEPLYSRTLPAMPALRTRRNQA